MSSRSREKSLEKESELLVSFVNTRDVETQTDAIASPEGLEGWIAGSGLGIGSPQVGLDAHRRVLALRESLRALMRANNGGELRDADLEPLREVAGRGRLRASVGLDGGVEIGPDEGGLAAFEARLLLAVERVQALGGWERLKACPAEDCQWAFVDSSRNRSRTWCSMDVCGNRSKTRRYRSHRESEAS